MGKRYIFFAFIAALLYAVNIPLSKLILNTMGSTLLSGFLYLGAGLGMSLFFLSSKKKIKKDELLSKNDLPYTIAMVILDILAPICLLYGLSQTNAGGVSLLNNFEIVATSIIALLIFKEKISFKLWIAIILITISSFLLSMNDISSLEFSIGSLFVIIATIFWGFENNCTRKISNKNTYQIVMIKGLFSGIGALIIGLILKENIDMPIVVLLALLLGFVSYGLSIFFYILAQKGLGAAKTSAFYAINPFIGSLLSVLFFKEVLEWNYYIAFIIMAIGAIIIVLDTLKINKNVKKVNLPNKSDDEIIDLLFSEKSLVGKERLFYSKDKTKIVYIMKNTDKSYSVFYERLTIADDEERAIMGIYGWWEPYFSRKSYYETADLAYNDIKNEISDYIEMKKTKE